MSRILIVDDDEPFRRMLGVTLTKAGYDVAQAGNGREAIHLDFAEPADVVVTDLIMPDREGLETIQEFRRARPTVKIIAMSGGGRALACDFLTIARLLGADRTFAKPFSSHELIGAINELLSQGK
jgi:DNA-binding response OmpR family regulator